MEYVFFIIKDLEKSIYLWFFFCLIGTFILFVNKNFNFFTLSILPHANLFLMGLSIYNFRKLSFSFKIILLIFLTPHFLFLKDMMNLNIILFFILFLTFIILQKKINLNIKFLSYIGLLSYTWYLTHNAIGIILIRELNNLNYQIISIPLVIIFTFILSVIIYRFFEIKSKSLVIKIYKELKLKYNLK